jgi:hypothetical protein
LWIFLRLGTFCKYFPNFGRTAKIPDRGFISKKPEGLSAKSAKSGPWVDFPKVQGPLCKISEISKIMNYFLTDFVDQVHVSVDRPSALGPPWTDAGADNGHGGAR